MNISSNEQKYRSWLRYGFIQLYFRKLFIVLRGLEWSTALEVGCGEGRVLAVLSKQYPNSSFQGVDLSEVAVMQARARNPELNISVGNIHALPYNDDSFDMVFVLEVLEHIQDYDAALRELVRVSSKYVVVSVPREPWFSLGSLAVGKYICRFGRTPEHVNFWNLRSIKKVISRHATIERQTTTFFWTIIIARV